jgi:dTDP-4-dehydrorhamnose 3,5-epimerase
MSAPTAVKEAHAHKNGSVQIAGVAVRPLRCIPDERGAILHMMRCDDGHFEKFGEIYFSLVYPGVIKGWHLHKEMTLNYAVPSGMIKMVLYDARQDSPTQGQLMELFIGEKNYVLVTVPPGVWNGFKGIGMTPAVVANCATIPHHPQEIVRMSPFSEQIPYDWSLKHS